MKDADYRYVDDERHNCRRKCLKDYAMAVAVGVGIGMGAMMFWYEKSSLLKTDAARQEVKANYYDIGIPREMEMTQKGYDMLYQGFRELGRRHSWYDGRIWTNWCDVLRTTGDKVSDLNVKQLLSEVNNPTSPISKLSCKYRGPKTAPQPAQADEERFEELCQKYERFQPSIDALMDENHDDELTREERNKGLYKLLHQ